MNGMPILNKEQIKENIKLLQGDLQIAEQIAGFRQTAVLIRGMYDSFINSGFTEEQAWQLTYITVNNGTNIK